MNTKQIQTGQKIYRAKQLHTKAVLRAIILIFKSNPIWLRKKNILVLLLHPPTTDYDVDLLFKTHTVRVFDIVISEKNALDTE